MENAKKLGYNRRTIGIPWCQISDIESHFIKKGFKGNDLISKVDDDIVRLQNLYFEQGNKIILNKIKDIKKKLLEKQIQNNFYKNNDTNNDKNNDTININKITTNNKRINKNKKSKNNSKNNSKNKLKNNSKNNNNIDDKDKDKQEDIDKILNEVETEMKIKEKNDNVKKLKKIKSKIIEAKNKDNITKTSISDNNIDANVDTTEGSKIKKRKDGMDEHGMDVIEINSKTLRKPIQEYLFHLREQIISIDDYDDDDVVVNDDITIKEQYNQKTNFKKALSWVIESNEEKINKINMITKCHKIIYDKDLYHFKLYVRKDDREQYKKIINATVLISNMIGKFRENLETGRSFFKKTALMF